MNTTQTVLSSLALDLRRVALGYHRGSNVMAERFLEEALKRKDEINSLTVKPYIQRLLLKLAPIRLEKDIQKKAESALLYSILFQNAATRYTA